MSILDDDDPPSSVREPPARDLVKEAEVLTDPMKVILDIRKDIQKFQNGDGNIGKSVGNQPEAQRCRTTVGKYGTSGWFGTASRAPR